MPITDISAGTLAAYGILCAYIHALKTGQGQTVDASLLEAGIAYTIWESALYFAEGEIPGPLGSAHRVRPPTRHCAPATATSTSAPPPNPPGSSSAGRLAWMP